MPTTNVAQKEKHAYLIIAHGNIKILEMLLSAIDDDRNDIFVHVDKKAEEFPFAKIRNIVRSSKIAFVEQIDVNWGGYSLISAELRLLQEATKTEHAYYHLLSGVDFPLKSQDAIHRFLDENAGKEFIAFDQCAERMEEFKDRIRYYHWFQDKIGRNKGKLVAALSIIENTSISVQRAIGIDRLRKCPYEIKKGANWFSITHDLATYLLTKTNDNKYFKHSLCADELIVQTLAFASPYCDNIVKDNLRYIDWERGNPYTFVSADFSELVASDCLFARKFDENVDLNIVRMLYEHICARHLPVGE